MGKDQGKNICFKARAGISYISIVLHLLISLMLIFVFSGCGVLEGEFFGKKFGGPAQDTDGSSVEEAGDFTDEESEDEVLSDDTDKDGRVDEESGEPGIQDGLEDSGSPDENQIGLTLEELRYNFTEAMKHFRDE